MVTVQVDFLVHGGLLAGDLAAMAGRRLGALDRPVDAFGEIADLGVEAGLHHLSHRFDPGLSSFGDTAVGSHVMSHPGDTPLADQHLPLLALQEVLIQFEGLFSVFGASRAQPLPGVFQPLVVGLKDPHRGFAAHEGQLSPDLQCTAGLDELLGDAPRHQQLLALLFDVEEPLAEPTQNARCFGGLDVAG